MRNTPLKAFAKSALKHTEAEHKVEHANENPVSEKLKKFQKKIPPKGTTKKQ